VDWAGSALFGLVATAALTAVMITAQLAGLTRLDLPLVLGTLVTGDPDRARVAGFFIHLGSPIGSRSSTSTPTPLAALVRPDRPRPPLPGGRRAQPAHSPAADLLAVRGAGGRPNGPPWPPT